MTEQITVSKGATIRGYGEGAKAIFKAVGKISTGSIFKLEHDDAKLENIAITTAYASSGDFGRGVHITSKALVDSCVITNCRTHYAPYYGGGAVLMEADGAVRNCYFDYNSTYASGGNNASGHTIFMTAGLVDRCYILRGGRKSGASSSACVLMTGGTLRSSLVAGCTHSHENTLGIGVTAKGGTIENCTIAGNFHASSPNNAGLSIEYGNPVTVRNTIVWGNSNGTGTANVRYNATDKLFMENNCSLPAMRGLGNISDDPLFRDSASLDYDINYSRVVDKGVYLPWMASSRDLAGRRRKIGDAVDMGCFEFDSSLFSCGFDIVSSGNLDESLVRFAARAVGAYSGDLSYRWEYTDSNGNATVVEGSQYREFDAVVPAGLYSVSLTVTDSEGRTASLAREDAVSIAPSVLYVRLDGGNVYPYNTVAGAATNLSHAIEAAQDGSEIRLGDGWHVLLDSASIVKGIKIVSENGPEKTTVYGKVSHNGVPLFLVSNKDAVLSGITISGISQDGKTRPQQWGAIRITASGGTVTNCVVANHKTQLISIHGSGARLEGGTVVDSVFTNNHTHCSGGAGKRGGALYITGSQVLADRCVIANNMVDSGNVSYGGGVYIEKGTIRNSLLVGNYSANHGGGLAIAGSGKAVNLTIVKNTSGTGSPGIWQNGGTVENCIVWNNTTAGDPDNGDDPGFVDAEGGDFRLAFASVAVDGGIEADYGETDLDRLPRKSGPRVDLGCYEFDQSQFSLSIGYEKTGTFSSSPVVLRAKATPSDVILPYDQSFWTIDGTEPSESNYAFKGSTVTNLFAPGVYTVRFKTFVNSAVHEQTREDFFTVYGETVYLKESNPASRAPYATEETAATNLAEAVQYAMDGATVLIDDGHYSVDRTIPLSRAVRVVSKNGPESVTIDGMGKYRTFRLDNDGAVLSGIRIVRAYVWETGAALDLRRGTGTNLVVDSCTTTLGRGAVYIENGTLVDSTVTNCLITRSENNSPGSGVYINGADGLVDRCLVTDCSDVKTRNGSGGEANGAVYIYSGTIRSSVIANNHNYMTGGIVLNSGNVLNCTVYGNSFARPGSIGGVEAGSASVKVVNTIVSGNVCRTDSSPGDAKGNAACFTSCAVPGGYGVNSVTSGIKLLGRYPRPYDITVLSPLRDAGILQGWMTDAKDFYGRSRISGKGVDIGAGENGGAAPFRFFLR